MLFGGSGSPSGMLWGNYAARVSVGWDPGGGHGEGEQALMEKGRKL